MSRTSVKDRLEYPVHREIKFPPEKVWEVLFPLPLGTKVRVLNPPWYVQKYECNAIGEIIEVNQDKYGLSYVVRYLDRSTSWTHSWVKPKELEVVKLGIQSKNSLGKDI